MKFSWKTFVTGSIVTTCVWLLVSKKCPAAEWMRDCGKSVTEACKKFKATMNCNDCECDKAQPTENS